jgi:hypothetical protein
MAVSGWATCSSYLPSTLTSSNTSTMHPAILAALPIVALAHHHRTS